MHDRSLCLRIVRCVSGSFVVSPDRPDPSPRKMHLLCRNCWNNKGHHYRNSNRRQGPQCLNVIHNDLSEEDTSGCSDTDDADVSVHALGRAENCARNACMSKRVRAYMHACIYTHTTSWFLFSQGICEGCNNNTTLYWCNEYQCGQKHKFCSSCYYKDRCPCDYYPRKPWYYTAPRV